MVNLLKLFKLLTKKYFENKHSKLNFVTKLAHFETDVIIGSLMSMALLNLLKHD